MKKVVMSAMGMAALFGCITAYAGEEAAAPAPAPAPAKPAAAPATTEPKAPVLNPNNPLTEKVAREDIFEFTEKPKVTKEGEKWVITFASKAKCDATVSVLGPDGKVVCHLASGVLGKNAPYPFQQNSLAQKIEWDGKNDQGKPAPAGCKVRVALGLKASFAWTTPMLGGGDRYGKLGEPVTPERSLTAEEAKAWPKLKAPDGTECLVPYEMTGQYPGKDAKCLWGNNWMYRVAVDPIREEVYVSTGQTCFNGVWFRCDGKTGAWDKNFKVRAMELAFHPTTGLMYVRDMKEKPAFGNDWSCHFLSRRDHDGKIIRFTVPEADQDGEILMPSDPSAKNFGDGFAFSPNGKIYVLTDIRTAPAINYHGARPGPSVVVYDEEGNQIPRRKVVFNGKNKLRNCVDGDGKDAPDFGRLVEIPAGGTCGIGADRFGNFWVCSTARPVGPTAGKNDRQYFPEDMLGSEDLKTNTWFFSLYTGSVMKFGPAGAKLSDQEPATHWWWGNGSDYKKFRLDGLLWTYTGLTPITTSARECICQQGRFGIDNWGRAFVPQGHRQSVLVLDSNANTVLRIGKYGNAETKGPDICFTTPKYVAASDTGLYVADRALGRVLKANLEYAAEETVPLP
jgi:hypothetical protein